MKNFQLLIVFFLCVLNSYGQTATKSYGRIQVEITKEKHPKKIYSKVGIQSDFPGGDSSWVQSFEKQLNRSLQDIRRVKKGKYFVTASFIVAKDGHVADVRCDTDPGSEMCQQVLAILKKGISKWVPSGQPVREYRKSAVTHSENN